MTKGEYQDLVKEFLARLTPQAKRELESVATGVEEHDRQAAALVRAQLTATQTLEDYLRKRIG